MKSTAIRIKDIAIKAGVSTGTVDRVIHNRGRVAEDVKEKVLKIIEELNYEPNLMARALGSNKVYHLAVLIPDHKVDSYWEAPKLGIEKAERELKQYGIVIHQYIFNPYDADSFVRKAEQLTQSKPNGVFLSPIFYREVQPFFQKWRKRNIPFVLFNTQIPESNPLSYIGQDSYQSGYVAARLTHYGNPEPCSILIAHIDEEPSNAAHLLKKEQGFHDYFRKKDPDGKYTICRSDLNRQSMPAFRKQLDKDIAQNSSLRSIFVTTSKAYEIAKYLEEKGLSHIRIIGYDLLEKNLYYLNNDVISFLINQNPMGQGYWGISILTDFLVFKKPVPLIKYLPLDIVSAENVSYFTEASMLSFQAV
ncbi:LacI family transcriptional regulator [Flavihumibacter sp. R14]|nr:LacI family transcriptional regulator [Flavihumibacter soli]